MNNAYTKLQANYIQTRRIPGPANNLNSSKQISNNTFDFEQKQYAILDNKNIPLINPLFWQGAWLSGINDINIKVTFNNKKQMLEMQCSDQNHFKNNLSNIKQNDQTCFKINTEIIILIKEFMIKSKEARGEVIDPFGQMHCLIHRECFENKSNIDSGTVLILTNVSILHSGPTKDDYYVCITNSNIVKNYPQTTKIPIKWTKLMCNFHQKLGLALNDSSKVKNNIVQNCAPKSRHFVVKEFMHRFDEHKEENNIEFDEPVSKKMRISKESEEFNADALFSIQFDFS